MNTEALEQRINNVEYNSKEWWKSVQKDIDEIKQQISNLPDEIVKRLNETTDLKIQNKVQDLETRLAKRESDMYRWIIGLLIGSGVSLIISVIGLVRGI